MFTELLLGVICPFDELIKSPLGAELNVPPLVPVCVTLTTLPVLQNVPPA